MCVVFKKIVVEGGWGRWCDGNDNNDNNDDDNSDDGNHDLKIVRAHSRLDSYSTE